MYYNVLSNKSQHAEFMLTFRGLRSDKCKGIKVKPASGKEYKGNTAKAAGRPDGKNWDGLEYVDLNAPTYVAAVMLWKPAGASASKTVKLRGLNADAKYKLNFTDHTGLNGTKTGKELMESGLSVKFDEAVSSDIIYLTRE